MAVTKKTTKTMTMAEAAHRILLKHGKPMHYRELVKRAIAGKMITTAGKTPEQSLRSLMATEFVKRAAKSRFRPKGEGLYGLTPYGKKTPPAEAAAAATRKARRRRPLRKPAARPAAPAAETN